VVARYAVNWNAELAEQGPKILVSTGAVVLNQVARDDRDIGSPVAVLIMREH
jgi:hypothetical protein